ncbi:hypothetical protein IVA88_21815 [Bradyrhizobium sp. 149]|uniref:hypothetical protein n=1 Tax=Bradyrhizobium sp. 149 TaxID=2782624 RepID=UPI001FF9A451|nr:hypothetical protein [Bradyrhizobium sp. 149]MCK1654054.1 hypothetical protein [Bradyrhizobium sp. 149]
MKTVPRGIKVSNAARGTQGLPTWIPSTPCRRKVPLVSGMTRDGDDPTACAGTAKTWFDLFRTGLTDPLSDWFGEGRPPCPNCLPTHIAAATRLGSAALLSRTGNSSG